MKIRFITCVSIFLVSISFGQPVDPPWTTTDLGQVRLPVAPQRITSNIKLPMNTHSWNVNLYYNGTDWSDGDYPGMINLIADPLTIHVGNQGKWEPCITNMELQYVYNYGMGNPHVRIPHELSDALIVYPKSGKVGEPKLDAYSDWGIKMQWDGGKLEAFAATGCPFIYFHANDGGIKIDVPDSAVIWYNQGNAVGVEVFIWHYDNQTNNWHCFGSNNYVIYGPSGCEWNANQTPDGKIVFTSDLAGKNYASVASVPNDKEVAKRIANLKLFQKYAYSFITDTKVSWEYNAKKSVVKNTFEVTVDLKEGEVKNQLFALYPHQWLHYKGKIHEDITFKSTKGPMKIIETKGSFSIELPYYGILPHFPNIATSASGYSDTALADLVREQVALGEGNNIFQGNEIYATAVTIGRTAQVIEIAHQCELSEEKDTLMAWVKRALENWLQFSSDGDNAWLVYDKNYGALIGHPPNQGMFTDLHLNDAHFQMGYMIKAASVIAMHDKQWMKDWGERIEMLIRYVANWQRDDKEFPFLRFMDPYHGHSWATGDADFRDGNNQESSSEALNCYSGIALWGMITDNTTIRDLGIYLYTSESEAVMNYWWDYNDIVYPNGPDHGNQENAIWEPALYHYPASGWLWGDKIGFATWFGSEQTGKQEFPIGINLLPMTASSVYLARNTDYVRNKLIGWFLKKYGKVNRWNEVFWVYYGLAEGKKALDHFIASPHGEEEPCPPSETESHSYHWLHNMCAYGAYNSIIKADIPSYAVFGEGVKRTYIAYNPGETALTVNFIDGTTFSIPPGQLVAQQASDIVKPKPVNNTPRYTMSAIINNGAIQLRTEINESATITIYSLKGMKLHTIKVKKGLNLHTLQRPHLAAGLLLVDVITKTNKRTQNSLVIR